MAYTKTYYATSSQANSVEDSDIIVVQQGTGANLGEMKKTNIQAVRQPLTDAINAASLAEQGGEGKYISSISQEEGKVSASAVPFEATIGDSSSPNAPSVNAVKNYLIDQTNTGVILGKINERIGSLNSASSGADGSYIKNISESSGVIAAEVQPFEATITENTGNAPTSKAVKNYVDSSIANLTGSAGNSGTLIKSISQENGKISGTTIALENELSGNAESVPTSKAVKDAIGNLDSSVGGSNVLIKSITEENGVLSGDTIGIATSITNDPNSIPTSQAVYQLNQTSIYSALGNLAYTAGATGSYVKEVKQEDGQLSASLAAFDTSVIDNTGNAPTSKAVKNYVDAASSSLRGAINNLNHNTGKTGTAGTFLRWVSQTTGQLNSSEVAFSTTPIATGATGAAPASSPTYSSITDVAPTVKAVADQIKRLDGRADAIRGEITGLNYNTSVADGKYISGLTQATGKISVLLTDLASAATTGVKKAITSEAVRNAIDALDAASVGSDGSYLKTISETDGKISATKQAFDTDITTKVGTNNNAPTSLAVQNLVSRTKEQILEETEAMSYMGSVGSASDMASKASSAGRTPGEHFYDTGDVFIAKTEFNLLNGSSSAYNVLAGDLIIVNKNCAAIDATTVNNFDIIDSANQSITYGSQAAAVVGNFLAFSASSGKVVYDSGENALTIAARVSSSAEFARQASLSASYAASSASFADAEVEPYRKAASSSASQAKWWEDKSSSSASQAKWWEDKSSSSAEAALNKSTAASLSASYASSSAKLASGQAEAAINRAADAESALIGAQNSSNTAVSAKTGAQGSSDAAKLSASYAASFASNSSKAASYAASFASNSSKAASGAQDSSNAAKLSASYAASYASNSSKAASGSQDSSTAAATAAVNAGTSATAAACSASKAASYSSAANLEGIKNSASLSASYAASSADLALNKSTAASLSASYASSSAISASLSASYVSSFADANNLEGIKNAAEAAASGAQDSSTAAATSAANAGTSATAAACSASKAASYSTAANLEGIKNAASLSASYAASSANLASSTVSNKLDKVTTTTQAVASPVIFSSGIRTDELAIGSSSNYWSQRGGIAAEKIQASYVTLSEISPNIDNIYMNSAYVSFGSETPTGFDTKAYISANGAASFAQTVSANEFVANSSRKVKENIQPTIISALDLISKINVVDFNYITDEEKKPHIGFIAEDTDPLLSTPHHKGMDYTNCIGTLFKAVQEITKGIEKLEKRLDEMK